MTDQPDFEARLARALHDVAGPAREVDAGRVTHDARMSAGRARHHDIAGRHRYWPALIGIAAAVALVVVAGSQLQAPTQTGIGGGEASPSADPWSGWFLMGGDRFNSPPGGVYIARADGSDIRRVAEAEWPRGAAWSPDGSRIAFADGLAWHVVDVRDGDGQTRDVASDSDHCVSVTWAPDSESLASFVGSCEEGSPIELSIDAVDGSGSVPMERTAGAPAPGTAGFDVYGGGTSDSAWSADGTLAFPCVGGTKPGLCVAMLDEAAIATGRYTPRLLATSDVVPADWNWSQPRWSPDGRRLLAIATSPAQEGRGVHGGHDGSLVLLDPAAGTARVLATGSDGDASEQEAAAGTGFESARPVAPSWMPDGQAVLFGRYRNARLPHVLGWLLRLDETDPQLLFPAGRPMGLGWDIRGLSFEPRCAIEASPAGTLLLIRGFYADSGVAIGTLDGSTLDTFVTGSGTGAVCPSWQPRAFPVGDGLPGASPAPAFSDRDPKGQ